MENRMNRKDVSFSTLEEHVKEEREYWSKALVKEKLQTITYLRECFYGPEATTGCLLFLPVPFLLSLSLSQKIFQEVAVVFQRICFLIIETILH